MPVELTLPARVVAPLTPSELTPLTSPPKLALPVTFRLLIAPATVEPVVVLTLLAVSVVAAPKVTAPAYVWLPLVLTVPPFNAIALAEVFKLAKADVFPTLLLITIAALVPLAVIFKLRSVPSLFIVPLVVITAALPLAKSLALEAKVIAPA